MKSITVDIAVIGSGAAGMSAAAAACEAGARVAVFEREKYPGGILLQCIHNGFGLHHFKEELTGPEYAGKLARIIQNLNIPVYLDTTVLSALNDNNKPGEYKTLRAVSPEHGAMQINAKAVIIAAGSRERNRGNLGIPGTRPAGVFTAGLAQRLANIDGLIAGRRVVIAGSGDIGLIMARRMTWIGAKVLGVVEILPYPSGLARNIQQCLNDFNIPLYLSHSIIGISGKDRVSSVQIAPLSNGIPDLSRAFMLDCDTVLLSVGLIPDTELTAELGAEIYSSTGGPSTDWRYMTSVPGVFACGNALHIHDLVDFVSEEASRCGKAAAAWITQKGNQDTVLTDDLNASILQLQAGTNVRYVLPRTFSSAADTTVHLRPLINARSCRFVLHCQDKVYYEKKIPFARPAEMLRFTIPAGTIHAGNIPIGNVPVDNISQRTGHSKTIEAAILPPLKKRQANEFN